MTALTDSLLPLIGDYGLYLVFIVMFISCTAIPTPSSPMMMIAGGFAAAGDLVYFQVYLVALVAVIAGDNFTYVIAKLGGESLSDWINKGKNRAELFAKAQSFMEKRGAMAIFLSSWLIGPLGPYMNYVAGITRYNWLKFAFWRIFGAALWVAIYSGLGFLFADNITEISAIMGNISGAMVAGLAVIGLGFWAWNASHPKDRR